MTKEIIRLKRKKPEFKRQEQVKAKLENKWRYPRGKQSKLRRHNKARGFIPSSGYGSAKAIRGLHPSGLKEMIIHNVDELAKVTEGFCVRIAGTVGNRKRLIIQKKSEELKLKVLNPKKIEPKKKKVKKEVKKETKKEVKKDEKIVKPNKEDIKKAVEKEVVKEVKKKVEEKKE